MSLNSVKEEFKRFGIEDRILVFDKSSATVEEAAKRLNCKEQEIAKTMSFLVEDKVVIIVLAGDAKIDNSKYKHYFKAKAKMIPFDMVEELTSHQVGGVCPFGLPEGISVYLDESLRRFNYVYPACGSPNSAIKLSLNELEKYSNYKEWIDVSKVVETE